jgi:hypothetical protein
MSSNRTFAQKEKTRTLDWPEFLQRKKYTELEMTDAQLLAADWVTCAVGTQCAAIPRSAGGRPLDDELRALGGLFYDLINKLQQKNLGGGPFGWVQRDALNILHRIEQRSAHLLRQTEEINDLRNIRGPKPSDRQG